MRAGLDTDIKLEDESDRAFDASAEALMPFDLQARKRALIRALARTERFIRSEQTFTKQRTNAPVKTLGVGTQSSTTIKSTLQRTLYEFIDGHRGAPIEDMAVYLYASSDERSCRNVRANLYQLMKAGRVRSFSRGRWSWPTSATPPQNRPPRLAARQSHPPRFPK